MPGRKESVGNRANRADVYSSNKQQGILLFCPCSSVAEHSLGKGEVACSIHAMGTKIELGVVTLNNVFMNLL